MTDSLLPVPINARRAARISSLESDVGWMSQGSGGGVVSSSVDTTTHAITQNVGGFSSDTLSASPRVTIYAPPGAVVSAIAIADFAMTVGSTGGSSTDWAVMGVMLTPTVGGSPSLADDTGAITNQTSYLVSASATGRLWSTAMPASIIVPAGGAVEARFWYGVRNFAQAVNTTTAVWQSRILAWVDRPG